MTGRSASTTETKKKHRLTFSKTSLAVQVMRVTPAGKVDPDGGAQTTFVLEQSDTVGAG
jgi:hypothetical protein